MSITQGLFSDVLANAPQPQGGSADWSRTLPMAGAVDWANVRPFQVINPLTGYSFGATQPLETKQDTKAEEPQLSEYQKWLAQQSAPKTESSHSGNSSTMTDSEDRLAKDMRNAYGGFSPADKLGFSALAKFAGGALTGNPLIGFSAAIKDAQKQQELAQNFQSFINGQGRSNFDAAIAGQNYLSSLGIPVNTTSFTPQPTSDVNAIINSAIQAGNASANFGTSGRSADSVASDARTIAGGMGQSITGDTSGMSSVY